MAEEFAEPTHAAMARHEARYHHGDLRSALLTAAEGELRQVGIEGFSLRSVAKRAGVSHAAPAHHFKDVRGLLTGLATRAFERFVATQKQAMAEAEPDPVSQLAAAGLGYVRFARADPALFRLIFVSDRPDFEETALCEAADIAINLLKSQVRAVRGDTDKKPANELADVAAAWAISHGLADLLISGRLEEIETMPPNDRDETIRAIVTRTVRAFAS